MKSRNILLFIVLILFTINSACALYNIDGYIKYRADDGSLKPVPYAYVDFYNDTWGNHDIADADGEYSQFVPSNGYYTVVVSKDGYVTKSFVYYANTDNPAYDIIIDKQTTPNYILPHYVKFTVQNIWGNTKYENVDVTVYQNGTSVLTGKTGTEGSFGAMLSETMKYRITFINSTQGISREWYDYPIDNSYKIIVFGTSDIIPEEREEDDILFGLNSDRINVSSGYVNVTYNDTSLTTSSAILRIYEGESTEGTLYYSSTLTADNSSWSIIVPANNTNYTVQFTLTNGQLANPLIITRFISFYDNNRYDLGFDDGWNYIAIAVCIIVGIFALFSRVNAEIGAVVGVLAGWFLWMIGWLNNGLDTDARLTMGLMMLLATLIAFGTVIRKGEDV